jgi:hypothetical protein
MTYASEIFKASRVRGGSGALATPSLAFSTDVDTGLYLPSAGTLGVVAAGAELITVGTGDVVVDVSSIFKADKTQVEVVTVAGADSLDATTQAGRTIVYTSSSAVTVQLPDLTASEVGTTYLIGRLGTGTLTIDPDGGQLINGAATITIANQWSAVTVIGYTPGKWLAFGDWA